MMSDFRHTGNDSPPALRLPELPSSVQARLRAGVSRLMANTGIEALTAKVAKSSNNNSCHCNSRRRTLCFVSQGIIVRREKGLKTDPSGHTSQGPENRKTGYSGGLHNCTSHAALKPGGTTHLPQLCSMDDFKL